MSPQQTPSPEPTPSQQSTSSSQRRTSSFPEGSKYRRIEEINTTLLTSEHQDVPDTNFEDLHGERNDAFEHYKVEIWKQRHPGEEKVEIGREEHDIIQSEARMLMEAHMRAKYKDMYENFEILREEWREIMMDGVPKRPKR